MDNVIIYRGEAPRYFLPANVGLEFNRRLMGDEFIRYDITVAEALDLRAGDYIDWQGVRYTLFEEPAHKHAKAARTYSLAFYAPYHRLQHILHKDEGATQFSYFGSVGEHLAALLASIHGIDPAFTLGEIEENGTQLLEFTDTYCLDALTQICDAFKLEWRIRNKHIDVRRRLGGDTSYRFAYGRGNGLYSLEKKGVTNSKVATRMYGRGAVANLPHRYREGDIPMPKTLVFDGGYLEKNTAKYGVREEVVTFEDVFPRLKDAALTGVTSPADIDTATGWSVTVDLPFDLNAIAGEQETQIKFTTGELAGEGFTVTAHDPATGRLNFNVSDDNGYALPSRTRQPRVGDQYVLLNVVMPLEYVTAAEAELRERTQAALDKACDKAYAYTLAIDPRHVKRHAVGVDVGDSVLVSEDQGPGTSIRITELRYPLTDPRRLTLTLSDTVLYSSFAEKVADDIKEVTREVDAVYREARAFSRRAWRDAEELATMLETVKADLLLVGNHAAQLALSSTFTANPANNVGLLACGAGQLQHAIYKGATGGIWLLGDFELPLPENIPYYLYAKCRQSSGEALFYVSSTTIEVEAVTDWYHFPVGVISSPFEGARVFNSTHGFTQIAGGSVTTGRLQDAARKLIIDLDNGTIEGMVKLKAGATRDLGELATVAGNFTSIDGGLLLTTLIKMLIDGRETGGLAADLDNVLLWGGGTYAQALEGLAKIILRHDGSGQLAGGRVRWDAGGVVVEGSIATPFVSVNYSAGQTIDLSEDFNIIIGTTLVSGAHILLPTTAEYNGVQCSIFNTGVRYGSGSIYIKQANGSRFWVEHETEDPFLASQEINPTVPYAVCIGTNQLARFIALPVSGGVRWFCMNNRDLTYSHTMIQ